MKLLAAITGFILATSAAQASCTGDLPGSGVLNVHPDPVSDGVIGGIGPNQCGLEVTDYCDNGRCLAFFDGLSGYVDVSQLASGTITQPPGAFEYDLARADGTMSFMGQSQPFDISDGKPLRVVPQADHLLLSLPDPLPDNIVMRSTGSTGWEGRLPDWAGVPVTVDLFLDRVGATDASLELFADTQLVKLDVRLALKRVGGPAVARATAPAPASESVAPEQASACAQTDTLAQSVGASGRQDLIDKYYAAVGRAGITDWSARSEPQCAELLRHLDASNIRPGVFEQTTVPAPDPVPDAATNLCDALGAELRPILRGPASAERSALMMAMVSAGITSLVSATADQCAALAGALR